MKAITFAAPIPTYLLTMAAGALAPRLRVGRFACTRYGEVPDPALPGERWVRVRTRLGGICGIDDRPRVWPSGGELVALARRIAQRLLG